MRRPTLLVHHLLCHLDDIPFATIIFLVVLLGLLICHLSTCPLNAGVNPFLIIIKFLNSSVGNLLIISIDLPRFIISAETFEKIFELFKLRSSQSCSQEKDNQCRFHLYFPLLCLRLPPGSSSP